MKKPIVYFGLGALVILLFLSFYFFFFRVPTDFPVGSIYSVKEGAGLSALAKNLSSQKIIRSPFLFKTLSVIFGGLKGIKTGDYALSEKQNLISINEKTLIEIQQKFDLQREDNEKLTYLLTKSDEKIKNLKNLLFKFKKKN